MRRYGIILAALVCLLVSPRSSRAQQAPPADLLLTNGHIYASNPAQPWVEAVAIRGDRIEAVGSDRALAPYTRNDAYTDFMEDRIGSLEPGNLADVIVLSQALYKIPANDIVRPRWC
jgi:predicted amidohydrolase YtcJ